MEFLKTLFDGKALSQEEFEAALKEHSEIKLVNLSDGGYVSKSKYDDDLRAKDTNIKTLTDTIGERDKSLGDLKKQLETAGTDADLLKELQGKISTLETQAETDKKNYENALKAEKYKGACKDFASGLKFKSKADKEHFINHMVSKSLEMDGEKIIGATDFLYGYKTEYPDSFVEDKEPDPPAPPIDRRNPVPPPPKISLTERMKMANAKK